MQRGRVWHGLRDFLRDPGESFGGVGGRRAGAGLDAVIEEVKILRVARHPVQSVLGHRCVHLALRRRGRQCRIPPSERSDKICCGQHERWDEKEQGGEHEDASASASAKQ